MQVVNEAVKNLFTSKPHTVLSHNYQHIQLGIGINILFLAKTKKPQLNAAFFVISNGYLKCNF